MRKKKMNGSATAPEGAITLRTYGALRERYDIYARGKTNFLLIIGPPGLGKSHGLRQALADVAHLWIPSGRESAPQFFCDCFDHMDTPIVLDDADDLLKPGRGLQLLQALTETTEKKVLRWGSMTPLLRKRGVPMEYTTASHVCILTNSRLAAHWYRALASRGHLFYFDPTGEEWYAYCASWVTDQEILDHVHEVLPMMVRFDCRALTKAIEDKTVAGLPKEQWRQQIDILCDFKSEYEQVAWEIMRDPVFEKASRNQRGEVFAARTGAAGRTYYRWHEKLVSRLGSGAIARLAVASPSPVADPAEVSKCRTRIRAV